VAKIDRAYRVGGELKLVELKTRARDLVYMSDIIELSVQRIVVQDDQASQSPWTRGSSSRTATQLAVDRTAFRSQ
jgi:hypothetical protein